MNYRDWKNKDLVRSIAVHRIMQAKGDFTSVDEMRLGQMLAELRARIEQGEARMRANGRWYSNGAWYDQYTGR